MSHGLCENFCGCIGGKSLFVATTMALMLADWDAPQSAGRMNILFDRWLDRTLILISTHLPHRMTLPTKSRVQVQTFVLYSNIRLPSRRPCEFEGKRWRPNLLFGSLISKPDQDLPELGKDAIHMHEVFEQGLCNLQFSERVLLGQEAEFSCQLMLFLYVHGDQLHP